MIVSAHQLLFMPWLGFFHKMNKADVFLLDDNFQLAPRDYDRRVKIKTFAGVQWLTVPISRKNKSKQKMFETTIDTSNVSWQRKFLKTIFLSYGKCKYFDYYWDTIQSIFKKKQTNLSTLNVSIIDWLVSELNIKTKIIYPVPKNEINTYPLPNGANYVDQESYIGKLQATIYIIKATLFFKGTTYLSGPMGKNYLVEDLFAKYGIKLIYDNFQYPIYPQQHGEFKSGLSIIDMLFNIGPETEKYLKEGWL